LVPIIEPKPNIAKIAGVPTQSEVGFGMDQIDSWKIRARQTKNTTIPSGNFSHGGKSPFFPVQ